MQYISGIHALDIPCSLQTCGDWHCSALKWHNITFMHTENIFFKDHEIELQKRIAQHNETYALANHIHAVLNLLEIVNFSTAQGMDKDFICNDNNNDKIFEKVSSMKMLSIVGNAEALYDQFVTGESDRFRRKRWRGVMIKVMKQWYEKLFENYGNKYDNEPFTHGTAGECDFIEKELNYDRSLKIIDIGCGTGRHTIELTKRGYSVTGIDLSQSQLNKAKQKAETSGLKIDFLKHDARDLPFENQFDIAIMLCEGGFPLMETDEMNFDILKSVARSLKRPAKFIFTTLNGLFPLFHSINEFHETDANEETARYKSESFDVMTMRDKNITAFTDDDGIEFKLECNERYYMPSEITWLLKSLGFNKVEIFGAKLGAFSREDALATSDFEMLAIAEKQ